MVKVYKGIRIDEDLADAVTASQRDGETESDAFRRLIKAGVDSELAQSKPVPPSDAWTAYLDEVSKQMSEPPELDAWLAHKERLEGWRGEMCRKWQTPKAYFDDYPSLGTLLTTRKLLRGKRAERTVFDVLQASCAIDTVVSDVDYARHCAVPDKDATAGPSGGMKSFCRECPPHKPVLLIREYYLDWIDYERCDGRRWTQCIAAWQSLTPLSIKTMDDLLIALAKLNLDGNERYSNPVFSYDNPEQLQMIYGMWHVQSSR